MPVVEYQSGTEFPSYVKAHRLHYVYNVVGSTEQTIAADAELPTGENVVLSAAFVKDGEVAPGTATGLLSLYVDDQKVGEGRIKTQPGCSRSTVA